VLKQRRVWFGFGALAAGAVLLPQGLGSYQLHLLILVLINIVLASSLRLSLMVGQLNIGHSGFMAIGAYTSALLVKEVGLPFELGLLAGAGTAAIASIIIGYPSLRLRGVYFALVTVAFVEAVRLAATAWVSLTGGPSGMTVPRPNLLGVPLTTRSDQYYLALFLAALTLFILYRLERSRLGLTWKGIRQADNLAEAVGVDLTRYKLLAFVLASLFAGAAGSFYAHYIRFIFPPTFGFLLAVNILVYNFVGGRERLAGPIIGATFLTLLAEPFRGVTYYETLFFAIGLLLTVVLLPGGLVTLPQRLSGIYRTLLAKRAPVTRRRAPLIP